MAVTLVDLRGSPPQDVLEGVATLRMRVFREWPYLYDGDAAYEAAYLRSYADSADAIIVCAHDGEVLIGAATGAPMEDHADEFAEPLAEAGFDPADVFYCGESVLLPAYRGRGIGHEFFDRREAQGRKLGRPWCCFCGVVRPSDHPARPSGYRPLDPFWRKRGYTPLDGVTARFDWKDVDEPAELTKEMRIWVRALD